jgi:hypothetical protein
VSCLFFTAEGENTLSGVLPAHRACHCCGLIHRLPQLAQRERAICTRCQSTISASHSSVRSASRTAAAAVGALVLFWPAVLLPILEIERLGQRSQQSILGGTIELIHHGSYFVGVVVLLFSVVFPLTKIVLLIDWLAQLSRMWLVTLACLALAVGLTWHSLDAPGHEIVIRFPEGHGLKPGDVLRYRGIDIGHVESVQLNQALEGIDVNAVLDSSASAIACEGSRFWIVRPQLDFTGVSGLETAVGAKYIAVIPGHTKTKQSQFEGLSGRPPDGLGRDGIEIILRGDHRFGVHAGSPLTWRGVEVGQVLSSSLSPDALHIDTRVRIQDSYRRLLSRNSKFWVTSGIHMGLDVK